MILNSVDLALKFRDFTDVNGKIHREVKKGNLIKLTQGLFETDKHISGKYLAGRIYGPSYLSFDYALSLYGLIPESTQKTFTSATFNKRKAKRYQNYFGLFTYRDIPQEVFPYEVLLHEENGYSYQIATPEKALCDKLYTIPCCSNLTKLSTVLFDDLRIDRDGFQKLNKEILFQIGPLYHSTTINLLMKYMRRER